MRIITIILRIGVALMFTGHGILALQIRQEWLKYLTTVGIAETYAPSVMQVIGGLDLVIALIILIRPCKPVLIWAFIWALATAIIRPLSGEPFLEFVERGTNWAAPLVLLLIYYGDNKQ